MSNTIIQQGASDVRLGVRRGDTLAVQFEFLDSDEDPVDITGATARFQVRAAHDDDSTVISVDQSNGITITAASGLIDLETNVSEDLCGTYRWELEIVLSGGQVHTLCGGSLLVEKDVVRTD